MVTQDLFVNIFALDKRGHFHIFLRDHQGDPVDFHNARWKW